MADTIVSDKVVVEIGADLSPLSQSLSKAGRDVNQFASGTVGEAARTMTSAFNATSGAIGTSISKAARSGQVSIRDMVNSIVSDLSRIAIKRFIIAPIESAAQSLASSAVSAIGGLAVGGPAAPGSAYIVGEHGPEVFVPSGNGDIVPNSRLAGARPQIVVNVQTRDAESFFKSESQVAAMLTRALARGQKNL
jgi:phage-related minor tail protein